MRIAVVGSGISGISAAHLLQQQHEVSLFEKNDYVGGHTHTVVIPDGPDQGTPVDTGFIVLNQRTYPLLLRFLAQLNVECRQTDMSFGYYSPSSGLAYASTDLNSLFAQRLNLLRPDYWKFVFGITRFIRRTRRAHHAGAIGDVTLGEFLQQEGCDRDVVRRFVIPMAAAIWSAPDDMMLRFPMRNFARFYDNHGLLAVSGHPPWFFIKGGSHAYVKAFLQSFQGRVATGKGVKRIQRNETGVIIRFTDGEEAAFDRVVIAAHADEAYGMLADPDPVETRLLSPWRYSRNHTLLHTDDSLMPPQRRAWASWNYLRGDGDPDSAPITVTYHMNRLQRLTCRRQYFVTLNPRQAIPSSRIVREMTYTHPVYTFESYATQTELPGLNGRRNTYFCGSYFGYGFHEDGIRSGVAVARQFGIDL
ncbi:MAG: NAD(P)/FAD-dependent oxidoreductase [Thermodesulfobacteriota bacterium]